MDDECYRVLIAEFATLRDRWKNSSERHDALISYTAFATRPTKCRSFYTISPNKRVALDAMAQPLPAVIEVTVNQNVNQHAVRGSEGFR